MSERSSCGVSFGNVKIFDIDFADDAVIFVETQDILLGALEVLNGVGATGIMCFLGQI